MSFNPFSEQLQLPLFPDLSFDEIMSSEKISNLSVVSSSRLKRCWHLKISRQTGARLLTIPRYLETAPLSIKKALIEWALLPVHKCNSDTKLKKQYLEKMIQSHICNLDPILYSSRLDAVKLEHQTQGSRYNLRKVFNSVNSTYFKSSVRASVRWGSYSSLTSYQTTRTEKNGSRINLITIAGVYDHPDVPLFALEAVMYHEMLHIVVPPYKKNGRTIIHSPEFKQMECQFPYYKQWCEWEKNCLRNLAKSMKRKHSSKRSKL